jgi:hypothetical protein
MDSPAIEQYAENYQTIGFAGSEQHAILLTIPEQAIKSLPADRYKQMQKEIQDIVDKYTKGE